MTIPISPNEPKHERTGATDAKPWIISADPRFTTHEGGTVIVSGGTVYGDGYVIARAADILTTEQRAELMAMIRDFGNASFHVGYDSGHEMSSEEQVRLSEKRRDEAIAAISTKLNGGTE